jgi:hypothetical protein
MTARVVEYERILIDPVHAPNITECPICEIFHISTPSEACDGVCPLWPCHSKARDKLYGEYYKLSPTERKRLAAKRLKELFKQLAKHDYYYK